MSAVVNVVAIACFSAVFGLCASACATGEDPACYDDLGCFSAGPPFKSNVRPLSVVPSCPDHIRTKFILYTRDNPQKPQDLDARKVSHVKSTWTHFKDRPTKFIVHGFVDDNDIVSWLRDMKTAFLTNGDYNAIIVDWHHGNSFPYTQATANTRVVGAQIALLIKQLESDFKMAASQFHVIGHSLGSHVAGYAGERVIGMGRITGLDPAGPYFAGADKTVRLDPTDAVFVDTIHSDATNLLHFGFGMKQPIGHMDFYPNLGHDQPGCEKDPINFLKVLFTSGIPDAVACNHLRSIKYFKESINTKCPFMSFPCSSEEDFKNNKCFTCTKETCADMGLRAIENKPAAGTHVKYYTTTAKDPPYCEYHLFIKIRLATTHDSTDERGSVKLRLHGKGGVSDWLHLDANPVVYYPGKTYERTVGLPREFGALSSVEFQWHHMSSISNPFKWNLFGLRHPKLFLHEVDILREEKGETTKFCAFDHEVDNDESFAVYRPC